MLSSLPRNCFIEGSSPLAVSRPSAVSPHIILSLHPAPSHLHPASPKYPTTYSKSFSVKGTSSINTAEWTLKNIPSIIWKNKRIGRLSNSGTLLLGRSLSSSHF